MTTVYLAPGPFGAGGQFFGLGGLPLNLGTITTYAAGSTTPLATYTTSAGSVQNANPIVLGTDGRPPNEIWVTSDSYRFDLKDSLGNLIKTYDNLSTFASAANLTFSQTPTAAAGTVAAKLQQIVSVKDAPYNAVGDGVTDDTAAVTAAVAASGFIFFPPGGNYKISNVSCNGKAVTIYAYGATITYTSASGAFSKTDHGFKLTVLGGTFVASGATSVAIKYNATPTVNTFDDYLIRDGDFTNATNGYAVSLVGAREGNVQRCTFRGNATGGGGVYLQNSVSPFIESCQFIGAGAGKGVFYDGIGLGYDAGLVLDNSEIMGWGTNVDIRYTDWLKISGCTIDFAITSNLVIYSQDGATIEGNYLGSNTVAPAVQLSQGSLAIAPDFNNKITLGLNHFTGHYTGGNTYDCILIDDPGCSDITIVDNHIDFYTRYGINFKTSANILISGNTFSPRPTFGVLPIFNSTGAGDSAVRIIDNNFPAATSFAGSGLTFCTMRDNFGYNTNDLGAFITSGAGTTYNIPHGLSTTPNNVTLTTKAAAGGRPLWVTGVDATNIAIATDAVYAAFTVYWTATKRLGI